MKSIVVKVGGSLLYKPDLTLDHEFLKKFVTWFQNSNKRYSRVIVVVGGGILSRHLVEQAKPLLGSEAAMHNLAMEATVANAQLLRSLVGLENVVVPKTLGEAYECIVSSDKHIFSGGMKVGWSTDMVSAVYADVLGIDRVYKLSNIDHVYTKDPAKFSDAEVIGDIVWSEYFKMFGISADSTHAPNTHIPIDVTCSNFSAQKGISFFVSGGKNLDSSEDIDAVFESGTFIHS